MSVSSAIFELSADAVFKHEFPVSKDTGNVTISKMNGDVAKMTISVPAKYAHFDITVNTYTYTNEKITAPLKSIGFEQTDNKFLRHYAICVTDDYDIYYDANHILELKNLRAFTIYASERILYTSLYSPMREIGMYEFKADNKYTQKIRKDLTVTLDYVSNSVAMLSGINTKRYVVEQSSPLGVMTYTSDGVPVCYTDYYAIRDATDDDYTSVLRFEPKRGWTITATRYIRFNPVNADTDTVEDTTAGKACKISDELRDFIRAEMPHTYSGSNKMSRTDFAKALNVYVETHDLADGRKIKINPPLAKLLKPDGDLTWFNVHQYLKPHFSDSQNRKRKIEE
jgi:hypothetical protein